MSHTEHLSNIAIFFRGGVVSFSPFCPDGAIEYKALYATILSVLRVVVLGWYMSHADQWYCVVLLTKPAYCRWPHDLQQG